MHLVDLANVVRESDDQGLSGWYQFYTAAITSQKSESAKYKKAVENILIVRRTIEEDDATLLAHTFALQSDMFTKHHGDPYFCDVPSALQNQRQPPTVVQLPGHSQQPDRISNLLRNPEYGNPFCMTDAARKMASIRPEDGSLHSQLEASTAITHELGLGYIIGGFGSSYEMADFVQRYINKERSHFPIESSETVNARIDELVGEVDGILKSARCAPSAILFLISSGLAISVPLKLKISTARLLVRLARAHQRMDRIPEAMVLLDELDGIILSNGSHVDSGMLYLSRAETLLSLTSKVAESEDDHHNLICDALKNTQLAIAAFDRGHEKEYLLDCVGLAAALCTRLDIPGMCNFYAVKYLQIKASDMSERFFPVDGDALGQPKIPSEITHSPKAKKDPLLAAPGSPVGSARGLQTLIRWTTSHSN